MPKGFPDEPIPQSVRTDGPKNTQKDRKISEDLCKQLELLLDLDVQDKNIVAKAV